MNFRNPISRTALALACTAVLSGAGAALAQDAPQAVQPSPVPEAPEAPDVADVPEPPVQPDSPGRSARADAADRRNMIWDRVARQRMDAERQRLQAEGQRQQAEMRRLQAELQKLEVELRRTQEGARRAERDSNNRPGPRNPGSRGNQPDNPWNNPVPMPPNFGPGPRGQNFGPGTAPMNADPSGQPPQQPQSDWERDLMRAHGFGAESGGPGWAQAAYLGVTASPAPEALRRRLQLPSGIGLVVNGVEPGSPAERAGLKPNDILHKMNEQLLVNLEQLTVLVRTFKPGQEVKLSLVRGGKPTTLSVKLGERNMPPLPDGRPGPGPGPRNAPRPPMPGMPGMPPGMSGLPGTPGGPPAPQFPIAPGGPQGLSPRPFAQPFPQPAPMPTPRGGRALPPVRVQPLQPPQPAQPPQRPGVGLAPRVVVTPVMPPATPATASAEAPAAAAAAPAQP